MACTIFKNIFPYKYALSLVKPVSSISQKTLFYSVKTSQQSSDENDASAEKAAKAKKLKALISLIGVDKSRSYVTLEEAEKLSNRRGLKLIKLDGIDKRRECPIYQLFTGAQYLTEDIASKKSESSKTTGFKGQKIIAFSNKISEHDAQCKVQQMIKWLEKNYEVRVTISGTEAQDNKAEKFYQLIETNIGENGRVLQKRIKGMDIKFQLVPAKKTATKDDNTVKNNT